MLVGERMSQPVITVPPDMPIHDALVLFKKEHIRRAPVIKDGLWPQARRISNIKAVTVDLPLVPHTAIVR